MISFFIFNPNIKVTQFKSTYFWFYQIFIFRSISLLLFKVHFKSILNSHISYKSKVAWIFRKMLRSFLIVFFLDPREPLRLFPSCCTSRHKILYWFDYHQDLLASSTRLYCFNAVLLAHPETYCNPVLSLHDDLTKENRIRGSSY